MFKKRSRATAIDSLFVSNLLVFVFGNLKNYKREYRFGLDHLN